ncbi:unnamed protein product [Gordionus sp. m RMFG-2023]|uniref:cAMP-dependent protein kinase catalytic subunit alpha-like n=1 Tax=Gordionus sp. m RMFG-2023 TaxID=3053472 RepID=UPI0030E5CC39
MQKVYPQLKSSEKPKNLNSKPIQISPKKSHTSSGEKNKSNQAFDKKTLTNKNKETNLTNPNKNDEKEIRVVTVRNELFFKDNLALLKEQFQSKWKDPPTCPRVSDEEFDKLKVLGEGAFGKVYLVRHNKSHDNKVLFFATKVLNKEFIIRSKCKDHVLTEKRILQCINFPFLVTLYYYYKDSLNLYLVTEFVEGGDLFKHIKKLRRFSESQSKFYSAQVILAIEYLHSNGLVYRDLKPENILLDQWGYLKMTDFGFAKYMLLHNNQTNSSGRTWTVCGTPEYMAPEIIVQNRGYDGSVDWWSLGVLIFEMCAGYTPFRGKEEKEIFRNIVGHSYTRSSRFSDDCADLIENLLQNDVRRRYGCLKNGVTDITHHPWFYKLDWESINNKTFEAPYKPVKEDIKEKIETIGELKLNKDAKDIL